MSLGVDAFGSKNTSSGISESDSVFSVVSLVTLILSSPSIFGSTCFVHNLAHGKDKLALRAIKCVFLGYSRVQKGYHCYSPDIRSGTWELAALPLGKSTVGCRWVYAVKVGLDGKVDRLKLDIKNDFLHGDLEGEVYMEQPPGFVAQVGSRGLVCRLRLSLYGLKQYPQAWAVQQPGAFQLGKLPSAFQHGKARKADLEGS
nr:uncharacterized protein LOC104104070 [Nicotiana tomentosiformis]